MSCKSPRLISYKKQWCIVFQGPRIYSKWSINASFNYFRLLDDSDLWPCIPCDRHENGYRVASQLQFWQTVVQSLPRHFDSKYFFEACCAYVSRQFGATVGHLKLRTDLQLPLVVIDIFIMLRFFTCLKRGNIKSTRLQTNYEYRKIAVRSLWRTISELLTFTLTFGAPNDKEWSKWKGNVMLRLWERILVNKCSFFTFNFFLARSLYCCCGCLDLLIVWAVKLLKNHSQEDCSWLKDAL